ncbi:MAG TPA: hypothetical protein VE860_26080 [Chthoniobacterales bacterium]|jgi:hypothetical protein|nr:hypothetical protein [Chthoniobacterales bacterium]
MNSIYDYVRVEESVPSLFETVDEGFAFRPLGTFAGTICKVLYRLNGKVVPSDTSDQLIFDRAKLR